MREFATSKDGTRVPVSILRTKGLKLDGSHPTVVTGYGGYGMSMQPFHSAPLKALLEAGVVFAVANLRGGGEFGEQWHDQGRLTHKQNVFDDFEAVLRHLIKRGYTNSQRLGIMGGSNGGLLRPPLSPRTLSWFERRSSWSGFSTCFGASCRRTALSTPSSTEL